MNDTNTIDSYTERELAQIIRRVNALKAQDRSILKSLGHRESKRGKRRALALLIGDRNGGRISVSSLRWACSDEGLYETRGDRANFTQDMRKDAARGLWTEHTYKYGRTLSGHWELTEKGASLASRYANAVTPVDHATFVEKLVNTHKAIASSITITAKAATCAFCRGEIDDTDKVKCDCCANVLHATCHAEFWRRECRECDGEGHSVPYMGYRVHGPRHQILCTNCNGLGSIAKTKCINSGTTARCYGTYQIIATPTPPDGN